MQAPTKAIPQENQCNLTLAATLLNEQHIVCINNGWLTVKPSNSSLMEEACDVAFSCWVRFPVREIAPYALLAVERAYVVFFVPFASQRIILPVHRFGGSNIHVHA